MNRSEQGFTLIEVTIVAALSTLILLGAFEVVRMMLASSRTIAHRTAQYAEMEALVARLSNEARTAEAITIPVPGCTAIEMYARDPGQNGSAHFWSYRYDTNAKTIVRNTSSSGPLSPCTLQNGQIVASNVSAFASTLLPMSGPGGLAGRGDAPYLDTTGATNVSFPLGVYEADGSTPVSSGNAIVEVSMSGPVSARTIDLSPGVTPSGYTLTLQYTCNARCDPTTPHDGARINACSAPYGFQPPTTGAYVTHTTLITPNTPAYNGVAVQWPPGVPVYESFDYPDTWQIAGYVDYHYTGADTRDQIVPFTVSVPGDPNDAANGYYPAYIAPLDTNATASELIAHVNGLPQALIDQNTACTALNTSAVYKNG